MKNKFAVWGLIVAIIAALIGAGGAIVAAIITNNSSVPSTPSTGTSTAPPARIVNSGTIVLRGGLFDFDTGAETTNGTDIEWTQATVACPPSNPTCGPSSIWEILPQNSATIVNLGMIDFKGITPDQLQSYSYGT